MPPPPDEFDDEPELVDDEEFSDDDEFLDEFGGGESWINGAGVPGSSDSFQEDFGPIESFGPPPSSGSSSDPEFSDKFKDEFEEDEL